MIDVALAVSVVSGGDDSPRGHDPNGVLAARCQPDHVCPSDDFARSCPHISGGDDVSVALEPDSVKVARRDTREVAPISDGALPRWLFPAAKTIPSARSPTECQSPQEVASISVHESYCQDLWIGVSRDLLITS